MFICLHGINVNLLLQDSTPPPTECTVASASLVSTDDQCSRAVRGLFSRNESAIADFYYDDCPMRFLNYAIACSSEFGGDVVNFSS